MRLPPAFETRLSVPRNALAKAASKINFDKALEKEIVSIRFVLSFPNYSLVNIGWTHVLSGPTRITENSAMGACIYRRANGHYTCPVQIPGRHGQSCLVRAV